VRTTKFLARNNGGGVRQESSPQSATNHSTNIGGNYKRRPTVINQNNSLKWNFLVLRLKISNQ